MSLDYHIYAADDAPISRAKLTSSALQGGWCLKVLLNAAWDWSSYELGTEGNLSTSDVVFGWEMGDEHHELFERILAEGDAEAIGDACSNSGLSWANISIEEFDFATYFDNESQEDMRSDLDEAVFALMNVPKCC